jgi:Glyoxalase-like domain
MTVDHLVWYCANLDEGARYFADKMDREPAYGGVHPGEGTRNSLLSLADNTYVEILGRDPAQPATHLDPELRDLTGSGLYHWAIGVADLELVRHNALLAGLDGSEIVTGGRSLPNGKWLSWKLFGIRNHGLSALVPFFINWMESEHPAKTAPRGGSFIKVEVISPEPDPLRAIYKVLGLDIPVAKARLAGFCATIESRKGRHNLRMFDPVPRGFVI